jgi:hypothetical protein
MRITTLCTVVLLNCATALSSFGQPAFVLQDVTVIDVSQGSAVAHQTIVTVGARISEVGVAGKVRVPKGAVPIDGTGKYVIPGLWDMHVHIRGSKTGNPGALAVENEQLLALYLTNGITGIREMGGDLIQKTIQWRDEIASGTRIGPRILTAGPKLDGPRPYWPGSIPVQTVDEARSALETVKRLKADFVKIYNTPPNMPREAYFAILSGARAQGMHVTGHLIKDVPYSEAAEAGQEFEHIQGMLAACTRRGAELAKGTPMESLEERVRNFDPEIARAFARTLVQYGTWVTPTLDVSFALANPHRTDEPPDPRMRYLPKGYAATFGDRVRAGVQQPQAGPTIEVLQTWHKKCQELTGLLQQAGVLLLAGSDTGATNDDKYPGFSLHDELRRLVEAGLTPAQALKTATWNPAKWQGRLDQSGSIEQSKLADMVLLDANPLADIRNTSKIRGVFANGRWLDRRSLDAMLEKLLTYAR